MVKRIKKSLLLFVASIISVSSAYAESALAGSSEGGLSALLPQVADYIIDMLMIPSSLDSGPVLMWLGGFTFTIYAFRIIVENFDDKLGGWISSSNGVTGSSNKEYWFIGVLLTLIFIGGTEFMGWINDLATLLLISIGLLFIGMAIRALWFGTSFIGGSVTSVANSARNTSVGRYTRSAFDSAQSTWGSGGAIDSAYNAYKSIPRCDANNHLNPQDAPSGTGAPYNCWVDGCGGNWSP